MKALKRAKVLFASLGLCFATLGCALLGVSPLTAVADGSTTVAAGDLVVAESNATVTAASETAFTMQNGTTASESYTGLYVNATTQGTGKDVTWKAAINGVFQDSMSMEYLLATPAPYSAGYFTISICDLDGNVICQSKHSRSQNNDVSWLYNSKVQFIVGSETKSTNTYMLPAQGYYDADATSMGKITATLDENNALTVKEMKNQDGTVTEVTLGTVENATALADGFTVKFTSGAWLDTASQSTMSLLIASINGVATTGATVETQERNAITYEGERVVSGKNVIRLGEGSALKNFSLQTVPTVGSLELAATNAEFAHSETLADKTVGEYAITVVNGSASKDYTVIVEEPYKAESLIASTKAATVEVATTKTITNKAGTLSKEFTGIYLNQNGASDWGAKINGSFKGSMEMEYVLPEYNTNLVPVSIVLSDLEGNPLYEIRNNYLWGDYAQSYSGQASIYDVVNKAVVNDYKPTGILPSPGYPKAGKLAVSIDENNGLSVFVTKENGSTLNLTDVASTTDVVETIAAPALANGFTVSFKNGNVGGGACPSVLITALNGVSTAGENLELDSFSQDIAYAGEKLVGNAATIDVYVGEGLKPFTVTKEFGLGRSYIVKMVEEEILYTQEDFATKAEGEYSISVVDGERSKTYAVRVQTGRTVTFDCNGGTALTALRYGKYNASETVLPTPERTNWTFDGWYEVVGGVMQSQQITSLAGLDKDITLKARWKDEIAPVIALHNLAERVTVDNPANFKIAATDVTANDAAEGSITGEKLSIEVKVPQSDTFQTWNSANFNAGLFGVYEIRYTAKDSSNNAASVTRYIDYIVPLPVLTVASGLPQTALVGQTITLPTATVEYSTALSATVSVTLGGVEVAIVSGGFTPDAEGSYLVNYLVKDEYEREVSKSFTVVVSADEIAPVITVDFENKSVQTGSTVTLPAATATDNVGVQGSVLVSVSKGNKDVALTNNQFTASEAGIYMVRYTATDVNGLVSVLTFEITVLDEAPTSSESAPNGGASTDSAPVSDGEQESGGCSSSLVNVSMLVTLGFAFALVFAARKLKIKK